MDEKDNVKEGVEVLIHLKLLMHVKLYLLKKHLESLVEVFDEENQELLHIAKESCKNETVRKWLCENSVSGTFAKLVCLYKFFKGKIFEEEAKHYGAENHVDITFVSHGAIRDFMIPACCLLPLPSITDVVLYAPWNCTTSGDEYGIATGKIKPQHRTFNCGKEGCAIKDHTPAKLPDHWNSMKKAGESLIPNIMVSPLEANGQVWKQFENMSEKYGPPGKNRIVIPFILPEEMDISIPFSVVTLALSLVLLKSKFRATVHLSTCLNDASSSKKFDKEYLRSQYACAIDNTNMNVSEDVYEAESSIFFRLKKIVFGI